MCRSWQLGNLGDLVAPVAHAAERFVVLAMMLKLMTSEKYVIVSYSKYLAAHIKAELAGIGINVKSSRGAIWGLGIHMHGEKEEAGCSWGTTYKGWRYTEKER